MRTLSLLFFVAAQVTPWLPRSALGVATTLSSGEVVASGWNRTPSGSCFANIRRSTQSPPLQNNDRKTLKELLKISPGVMELHRASHDWQSADEVVTRARELLGAQPKSLSTGINWSEGRDFQRLSFVVVMRADDAKETRIEMSGYQVCIRDPEGRTWYFRNVPVDLWP